MKQTSSIAIGLVALVLGGCSSSYKPAQSPRIAVVMEGGSYTLVRDGNSYPVGIFGGGVFDAVEGNRAAEEHARTFQTLTVAGAATYGVGLGATIGGIVVLSSNSNNFGSSSTRDAVGSALTLGGLSALIASIVLFMNAPPHMWDAINTYNDSVDAWRLPPPMQMPPPPPTVPPRAPASASVPPPASAPVPPPAPASVPVSP